MCIRLRSLAKIRKLDLLNITPSTSSIIFAARTPRNAPALPPPPQSVAALLWLGSGMQTVLIMTFTVYATVWSGARRSAEGTVGFPTAAFIGRALRSEIRLRIFHIRSCELQMSKGSHKRFKKNKKKILE